MLRPTFAAILRLLPAIVSALFACSPAIGAEAMEADDAPSSNVPTGPVGPIEPMQPAAPGVQGVPATPRPDDIQEPQTRLVPEGVPSLQLTPDFVSPALAFGGNFPTPEIESGAIKVGPVTVRAGISTGVGFDDNVTFAPTNTRSSFLYTLTPSLVLGLEGESHRYFAAYRGNYGWYSSSAADDYNDHSFTLNASDVWTERLRTSARYDFFRGHDPRGITAATLTGADFWNQHRVSGNVSYGAGGAPAGIQGNISYLSRSYTTNREATAQRDFDQLDVGGTFSYRVGPKTRATVDYVHSEITHPTDRTQDASQNRVLVGATWEAMAATRGRAAIGYMVRDPDSPGVRRFSAPSYEVGLTWLPLTYSTVSVAGRRVFAEASEPNSNFIVLDVLSANWQHSWSGRVRTVLGYVYGREEHQGVSRTDTYHTFDARISYALQRRLRLGAQFRHDTRTSPDANFEYKRNLTLITLETAL